ncbi:Os01g0559150 [Oryza sativa Japonica Group]|uniref:Os01g0559150 protein n=1 Tax=Oryza sativa subsp. japonica TaxID=39947 RepID=A0A0P0V426_ORYSJ|nr:hypothetical protein EE612_003469 [Oryza sativa]BAS72707.1 Os01g0559150 [Oryza sativa Japonica Group]
MLLELRHHSPSGSSPKYSKGSSQWQSMLSSTYERIAWIAHHSFSGHNLYQVSLLENLCNLSRTLIPYRFLMQGTMLLNHTS